MILLGHIFNTALNKTSLCTSCTLSCLLEYTVIEFHIKQLTKIMRSAILSNPDSILSSLRKMKEILNSFKTKCRHKRKAMKMLSFSRQFNGDSLLTFVSSKAPAVINVQYMWLRFICFCTYIYFFFIVIYFSLESTFNIIAS